ncbi:MAG: LPS assembly lipoprotein LptE [bacterium]|nr:LPS assembly lipoprotein LptE [bacterium]
MRPACRRQRAGKRCERAGGLLQVALAAFLLAAAGCGYALEGTRKEGPLKNVNTIAIANFVNETQEPGLERTLTDATRAKFIVDGRIRVVDGGAAAVILEAKIRQYELIPIGFTRTDEVRRYRVAIKTLVTIRDTARGEILFSQNVESDSEFDLGATVSGTDAIRTETNSRVAVLFADELISLVLEGF